MLRRRERAWLDAATSAALRCNLPFPRTQARLHLHVFGQRASNVMPVCRVLVGLCPAAKRLTRISSRLVLLPARGRVLCCCRCHPVSNIHGHCCPRAANPPITILLYTPCQLDSANIHNATVSLSTVHAPTSNSHHTAPKLPLLASCSYKLSATSSARPPYTLLSSTHLTPDCYATQWAFAPI